MKKIFRKEFIIGFTAIAALAILYFGIEFLKGVNIFKASNYYYVNYTNVEGLAISAPVTVNGFKIGQVREINYQYDAAGSIMVELSLDKDMRLPEGTTAVLTTDLLGTASIVLDLGTDTSSTIDVGATIPGKQNPGLMGNVNNNILPSVESIFPKIDTLIGNLNAITGHPALTASISRLDAITTELETSSRQLNMILKSLSPITRDVKSITTNVDSMTINLVEVSNQISQARLDSLIANLQSTSANLETLTRQLNDPNSSIGKLTNDPELYNNINATVVSLDSLFTDIKKNPKRYINIKVF